MAIQIAVVIKALNEERHIVRSLESALAAVQSYRGEVVLADSGSSDATVEIASRYPVKIVQLANIAERSCGVGAQLGFQFIDADYIYVLDGDMELMADFLPVAVQKLQGDSQLAGVAGLVEELGGGNYEFEVRKASHDGRLTGRQDALDMGGLYRVEAIRKVGYLTNRNLHSYEEKELGRRLQAAGYGLERIAVPAIRHYGKTEQSLRLLLRRWKSRHIDGPGEWMRATMGTDSFWIIVLRFKQLWTIVAGWLAVLTAILLLPLSWLPLWLALGAHLLLLLLLAIKRRSLQQAVMGFIHLQFYAAGMVRGLFRKQLSPHQMINAVVLKSE